MIPWQGVLKLILIGTLSVYMDMMFWLVLALVGYQYWQLQKSQVNLFGVYGYSLRQQVLMAALLGTGGGILGSSLLTLVGVTLNQLGFEYIWPLALLLMAVHMRFLCFAYAGGLIALSNVLFGWPVVNVPQILALIAVLHVTESILIAVSGRYSAVPLIIQRDDGTLVGGFNLQNFWPLPLVLLAAVAVPNEQIAANMLHMPDWWPLLKSGLEPEAGKQWIYTMVPVVAALGYTDVAIANSPSVRRRSSALHLAYYSVTLLVLSLLSAQYTWLQGIAAMASPLGHELLIQYDNRREMRGKPKYVPPEYGVMVLDTVYASPARIIGLRPGDIVIGLGGYSVNSGNQLAEAISAASQEFTLELYRDGKLQRRIGRFFDGERMLGIILVPDGHEPYYVRLGEGGSWLWDWLKRKIKG